MAYEPALKDSRQVPKSPGMKYRHYAPKAELYLVEPQYTDELVKQLAVCRNQGKKTGVLCCGDTQYEADFKIDCGRDAQAYAQALFDALRQMDDLGAEVIFAEIPCDEGGIVPALMNRMLKASGGQVLAEGITTKIERL